MREFSDFLVLRQFCITLAGLRTWPSEGGTVGREARLGRSAVKRRGAVGPLLTEVAVGGASIRLHSGREYSVRNNFVLIFIQQVDVSLSSENMQTLRERILLPP